MMNVTTPRSYAYTQDEVAHRAFTKALLQALDENRRDKALALIKETPNVRYYLAKQATVVRSLEHAFYNRSPLILAAAKQDLDLVKSLLEHGADPNQIWYNGLAEQNIHVFYEIIDDLSIKTYQDVSSQIIGCLLEYGASLYKEHGHWRDTPLKCAKSKKIPELLEIIYIYEPKIKPYLLEAIIGSKNPVKLRAFFDKYTLDWDVDYKAYVEQAAQEPTLLPILLNSFGQDLKTKLVSLDDPIQLIKHELILRRANYNALDLLERSTRDLSYLQIGYLELALARAQNLAPELLSETLAFTLKPRLQKLYDGHCRKSPATYNEHQDATTLKKSYNSQ